MNYMGVDIGTSGCKAVIFSEEGEQLAAAGREYDIHYVDNGGAELDSDEVISKTFDVIRESSSQVKKNSIRGLSISSQGEAFTAVGFDDEVLCNAMVSSDQRSESLVEEFLQSFNKEELYQITGHTAHPLFTLFKLMWFKKNKPGLWQKTKFFLCFEDLLQYKLGLDPHISWSLAGRTMLFDIRKHKWSSVILSKLGISKSQLAIPSPSGSVAGYVNPSIARKLGLNNTIVVSGGHDQSCTALGSGIINEGSAMYAIGTVECITPVFNKPVLSEALFKNNLCSYDYVLSGKYNTVAYNLTGSNILKWFKDEFGYQEIKEAADTGANVYELLLKNIGSKPSGVMVLPYFAASGTPYFDTSTKGAIVGLRFFTHRNEILRGLLEGVVFEMRLNIELLEETGCSINEFRSAGGGTKSSLWMQLKSDVLDSKITTLNIKEGGCSGAAMLACAADKCIPVEQLAEKWVTPVTTFTPNPEFRQWYKERFKTYKKLYRNLKKLV